MAATGPQRSVSEANTTNVSSTTNSTSTRDIGFTGQQGADILGSFIAAARSLSQSGFDYSGRAINDNLGFSSGVTSGGFSLTNSVSSRALDTVDRTAMRTEEGLNNLINATRDFSQRSISAATGQSTPLQTLVGATTGASETAPTSPLLWIGLGLGVFALLKDN